MNIETTKNSKLVKFETFKIENQNMIFGGRAVKSLHDNGGDSDVN